MTRSMFALSSFPFFVLPYALLAWALADYVHGFWPALLWLVGLRTAFAVIEKASELLSWRLFRRLAAVQWLTAALTHPKVDPNEMCRDDAVFRFEALPQHMQVELIRWVADQGLVSSGRSESVINAAIRSAVSTAERCAQPEVRPTPSPHLER